MATQNITLRLDKALLDAVRMLAAARDMSVSGLFESLVRKTLAGDAAFRDRRRRFQRRLNEGFDLGSRGKAPLARAALHER